MPSKDSFINKLCLCIGLPEQNKVQSYNNAFMRRTSVQRAFKKCFGPLVIPLVIVIYLVNCGEIYRRTPSTILNPALNVTPSEITR